MTRKTLIVFSLMLMALLCAASLVSGQDVDTIEYGESVTGELTDREFEIAYEFTGSEGDVIVIYMAAVDTLGDLNRPELLLLNSENDVVADTADAFTIGEILLAAELEAEDTYTILATRQDGRAGDSVGEFTLDLIKLPVLELDKEVSETISSEDSDQYYAIRSDSSTLVLSYLKLSGTFSPMISINVINDEAGLDEVVVLQGSALERAAVNVPSEPGLYIVTVGEAPFDFNFNEVEAEYELMLVED